LKSLKNKSILKDIDIKKEIILKSSNLNENNNKEKNNVKLNDNNDNYIINKEETNTLKNINKNNKYEKEVNILIKNFTKKEKGNIIEGITSNWNRPSNFKLNTHSNENYLYKNTFIKSTPLRDNLINEANTNKKNRIILPDIKTPNCHRENTNLNINNNILHYSKSPQDIFRKNSNELYSEKTNLYKNMNLNNIINTNSNYLSDNTQTTTLATNSKINYIPNINENSNQYGMGLISGGSTSNNNIIIPILTVNRPASNFNCGGGMIHNIIDKENINKKTNKNENNADLFNISKYKNIRNKVCKSQEIKGRFNSSMKNKEIYNLFPGMQKMIIPNFHKIKIAKGMTNINLGNSLTQKYTIDYKNNFQNYESKLKKLL
jgi:hypothetical protein